MCRESWIYLNLSLLLSVWFVCEICFTSAATLDDEHRLRRQIFVNQSYNPAIRPRYNQSDPVVVQSYFNLHHIGGLDEIKQSFQTTGWLTLSWTDEIIRWNSSDYGGIEQLLLARDIIWKPDLMLNNGIDGYKRVGSADQLLHVTGETGEVLWTPGDAYQTACSVDVTFYPFDVQSCSIIFESWMHDQSFLQFHSIRDTIAFGSFNENGQWTIISSSSRHLTETDSVGALSLLEFKLVIARKPLYYIINTISPIFVLSLMSLLVFLLPPESGEKMTLSITVLLSLTVFLTLISQTMPKTSKSVSLLAVYVVLVMAVDALSVMLSCIVLHFYYKTSQDSDENRSRDITGAWKQFASSSTKMISRICGTDKNSELMSDADGMEQSATTWHAEKVVLARMIDRISFISLGIILLIAMIVLSSVVLSHKA